MISHKYSLAIIVTHIMRDLWPFAEGDAYIKGKSYNSITKRHF